MCGSCWQKFGSPQIDTPDVRHAADLIDQLYRTPGCEMGGPWHVVVDDWNLEDEHVAYCATEWQDWWAEWGQGPPRPDHVLVPLAELIPALTETERASALAWYWKLPVPP